MINILLLLILGALTVIGWFIKDSSILLRELKVEKFRSINKRNLQVEAFFKQIKGSEIDEAFRYWTSMLMDMDNAMKDIESQRWKKEHIKMQQIVFMYGSERTVSILTAMMQHQYNQDRIENKVNISFGSQENSKKEIQSFILMIYIAYLVCSLKLDFTGHNVEPMNLIKIKITDIETEKNKKIFEDAHSFVKEDLKKYDVES